MCAHCKRHPATVPYRQCDACRLRGRRHQAAYRTRRGDAYRAAHRAYCHKRYGSRRIATKAKARAWLATAPRTPKQLAELLNISRQHAATLLYQLRQEQAHG